MRVVNIKNRAILIVALLIVSLSAFHLVAGVRQYNAENKRLLLLQQDEFSRTITSIKRNLFDLYLIRLQNIAKVRTDITKAFADKDRDKLYQLTKPIYKTFTKENPHLYVMHFHEPGVKSFLRMHKPDFYGDDLHLVRPAIQHVHNIQQPVNGFEIGRYGAFYRIIQPIFHNDQYVGALEVGIEAYYLIETVTENLSVAAALYYQSDKWKKATLNQASTRQFNDLSLVYRNESVFGELPRDIKLTGKEMEVEIQDRYYLIHRQPLITNYKDEIIGGVIALQDITSLKYQKKSFILNSIGFTTLLLAASYIVLYFSFGILMGAIDRYQGKQGELISELTNEIAIRKETEESLRSSEAKLSAMLSSLGDHIIMVNREHEIVWANDIAWGRKGSDIIGKKCSDIAGCNDNKQESVLCPAAKAFADGKPHETEIRIKDEKDGTKTYQCMANVALRDETGKAATVIEVFRDITARRRTEVELEKLNHRYQRLLEAAGDGIYGVDLNGKTTFVNPKALEITGFSEEEIVGQHQHDLFHHTKANGNHYPHNECLILKAMKEDKIYHVAEEIFWRKDGTSFPVEYVGTPVREEGQITGAVVVFKDITERVNLEGQLLQAQKMEAVGRLAGGIAHDFNNQLTAILGYGELLQIKMDPDDDLQCHVHAIIEAAESSAGLTRQLLAFSRKQVLTIQPVDMCKVVNRLSTMISRLIGEDVALQVSCKEMQRHIMADPIQLEQIIMNLVINARDAMPGGGTLTIQAERFTIDEPYTAQHENIEPGDYERLTVTDTGTGIPAAVQEKMFEPFFTTKDHGQGTGLGLATVHGIVKQHNGHIHLHSTLGKGTTFEIIFPLTNQKEEKPQTEPTDTQLPCGSETILIVDDEDLIRMMLREVLEFLGYRIFTASSAEEALQHLGNTEISLLLTDFSMPGMNGLELVKEMKESLPELEVIIMSGYSDKVIMNEDMSKAGITFAHKPISTSGLATKLRELLSPHSHPSA
jgi:PAS domain S-box-containing protein